MMMSSYSSSSCRTINGNNNNCQISDHNSSSSNNELLFMNNNNDNNNNNFRSAKRVRPYEEKNAAGLHKFKGVVPQQNGHWGAQIYANHQRIWLGTFKSEREAAMAYDSATIKLRRSGESHRNFPWNDQTVKEPQFQGQYTTEAVLAMIRDGSYPSKFATFLRQRQGQGEEEDHHDEPVLGVVSGEEDKKKMIIRVLVKKEEQYLRCTQLFQKELTPSDVGKLNRLVIPKKHALTYFPNYSGNNKEMVMMDDDDIEVVFYDKLMRSWRFRYCYWKSSQSYVFTRGWNRFVKDKKLKPKDIIAFYLCEPPPGQQQQQVFSLIDVIYTAAAHDDEMIDTKHILMSRNVENDEVDDIIIDGEDDDRMDLNDHHAPKGFRLFGVCID